MDKIFDVFNLSNDSIKINLLKTHFWAMQKTTEVHL